MWSKSIIDISSNFFIWLSVLAEYTRSAFLNFVIAESLYKKFDLESFPDTKIIYTYRGQSLPIKVQIGTEFQYISGKLPKLTYVDPNTDNLFLGSFQYY